FIQITGNAYSMGGLSHHFWSKLLHHIGRDRVNGSGHGFPDGHSLIREFSVRVFRAVGRLTWNGHFYRLINDSIARTVAVFNGCSIYKGLEGGSRLALTLFDVIVCKVLVVGPSHPCFYMTGGRIHRDKPRL